MATALVVLVQSGTVWTSLMKQVKITSKCSLLSGVVNYLYKTSVATNGKGVEAEEFLWVRRVTGGTPILGALHAAPYRVVAVYRHERLVERATKETIELSTPRVPGDSAEGKRRKSIACTAFGTTTCSFPCARWNVIPSLFCENDISLRLCNLATMSRQK